MCGAACPGHAGASVAYGAAPPSTCSEWTGGRCLPGPLLPIRSGEHGARRTLCLDAVSSQPTRLNATARGRCLPAGHVANRMPLCAARRAASGSSARPCTRVWIFGATRNPAGTWAAACPWRRRSAPGGLRTVPSDGANKGRWATAGLHTGLRVASSGADPAGAPWRSASGALHSALVGAQPTTILALRPSNAGKAAAFSRHALHLRRASVVSTGEAGTDDAGIPTSCKAAAGLSLNNG